MKLNFIVLFLLFSISTYSQINYEKGYYINESNEKINCLIKNLDWVNNPNTISIKYSKDDKVKTLSIDEVKEFEIYDKNKYIRKEVNLDVSGKNLSDMTSTRNPVFEIKTIFLKVIFSGEVNLHEYRNGEIIRFFYSIKDVKEFEPLIYKVYRSDNESIGENESFKQELLFNLKCDDLSNKDFENLRYKKKSLIKLFKKYSTCASLDYKEYKKESKDYDSFNLNIRPGVSFTSMELQLNGFNPYLIKLEEKTSFRFGVEAEFILNFNNNKWAIIVEPTYGKYESTTNLPDAVNNRYSNVNDRLLETEYTYLEIPLGLRYYFFLNNDSKIFINGSFVIATSFGSTIDFPYGIDNVKALEYGSSTNLAFGLGFKFLDKFSAEFRVQTIKSFSEPILGSYTGESKIKSMSLVFGYTLF